MPDPNSCIQAQKPELHALCRTYGGERLTLFGSATSGAFDATSDLDFIVAFADTSPGYADRYLDLAEALEALLGRDVDLVTERSISSPYFRKTVDSTREGSMTDAVKKRLPEARSEPGPSGTR